MVNKSKPQVWKIFARLPGDSEDYAAECYKFDKIAVGWNKVGDLYQYDSREALKRRLKKTESQWIRGKPGKVKSWASSLWNFRDAAKKGDVVLCPNEAGGIYVGRILSTRVLHEDDRMGNCEFNHRKRVQWFCLLNENEVHSIWKNGRPGGIQTVARVWTGWKRLGKYLHHPKIGKSTRIGKVPRRPDKEWGNLAEKRALQWLAKKGRQPMNVANLCRGWDIECDDEKFEVKGRKSYRTTIRLTENEWKAAKRFGKKFTILLFTAHTEKELNVAVPREIPDPARTESWKEKLIYEYFLNE